MKPTSKLYSQYKNCVLRITTKNKEGDLVTGSGFHIGGGYIATAKHVIESGELEEITDWTGTVTVACKRTLKPENPKIDLAVLETDFNLDGKHSFIPLGGHLDDWLGDEFVLTEVVVIGYPRIPCSLGGDLVAASGEVNAVIDRYNAPHVHFIISTIARGGFSGGPVISEWGFLLGVFIESLTHMDQSSENGFSAIISIEPLLVLLHENNIIIEGNENVVTSVIIEEGAIPNSPYAGALMPLSSCSSR